MITFAISQDSLIKIILIFFLIFLNAFFVAAEYSLLTLRKSKLDIYIRKRMSGFKPVRDAHNNLFVIISTIQLGSTLINILLGFLGEPIIEKIIFPYIPNRPVAIVLTIAALAFIQMIFGELIPKTIALQRAEIISRITIWPINFFSFLFRPFLFIITFISGLFLRLINLRLISSKSVDYTQEEVKFILDECKKNGIIPPHQVNLMAKILELKELPVSKLMTPKNKLISFSFEDEISYIKETLINKKYLYNRYPIYNKEKKIIGFIHLSDILRFSDIHADETKLSQTSLLNKILLVPATKKLDEMLTDMRKSEIYMAVIQDKDERPIGVITLVDIIEHLVER